MLLVHESWLPREDGNITSEKTIAIAKAAVLLAITLILAAMGLTQLGSDLSAPAPEGVAVSSIQSESGH